MVTTPVLLPENLLDKEPGCVQSVGLQISDRTEQTQKDLPTHPLWEGCLVPSRADRSQKACGLQELEGGEPPLWAGWFEEGSFFPGGGEILETVGWGRA